MRSLYVRLSTVFVVVLVLSVWAFWRAFEMVSEPANDRMIGRSQAALANEAAVAMRDGGLARVRQYLERLDRVTQMPHYLVDAAGRDVVSSVDRSEFLQLELPADEEQARGPIGDRFVFVTPAGDGAYRLITLAPIPWALSDLMPYFGLILGGAAILFWLIVANIVSPMRRLAEAVHRFGRGEFAARATVQRRDEIGQLAAAFNDMAERIETLVTAERRLLQDVSHELRSPLTRLNLAIELSRTAEDRGQAADRLQREASRLSDLVATLLEVVRLEGDPGSTPMARVRLMDVLRDSVENGVTEAERRNVRVQISGDIAGAINGSAELLRRAFDNIIGNAVRYAPAGSVVTVACGSTPGEHVVDVRDTGPGVRQEQLSELGQPFYRADDSRSSDSGGVGLGLAIACRAIHLHRGAVQFANADPGLRVTVRIPAEQGQSDAPVAAHALTAPGAGALQTPCSRRREPTA